MEQQDEIIPIKVKIENEENYLRLYVLSDLHIGDSLCDIKKIKEVVDFIKKDRNMYVILLGDILNTALANSKSDIYSEVMNISEAQKLAVELLSPIKDRILAMVSGNHENRVWRETGLDLSLWMAEKLGCEDKYRLGGLALTVDFGKTPKNRKYRLKIFGQHGSRGGRKLGGPLSAVEEMDGIVSNADIYIMGHTHQSVQGERRVYQFNSQGNLEVQHKCYFNVPAFLKYGGYGYEKGYKPGSDLPCYLNIRPYCTYDEKKTQYEHFKIDKIIM